MEFKPPQSIDLEWPGPLFNMKGWFVEGKMASSDDLLDIVHFDAVLEGIGTEMGGQRMALQ
jgi:dihydroneopterin aldolase